MRACPRPRCSAASVIRPCRASALVLLSVGVLLLASPIAGKNCARFELDDLHPGLRKKHVIKKQPPGEVTYGPANKLRTYETTYDEPIRQMTDHFTSILGDPLLLNEHAAVWFDARCGTYLQLAERREGHSVWARMGQEDEVLLVPGWWQTTTRPEPIESSRNVFERNQRPKTRYMQLRRGYVIILAEVGAEGSVDRVQVMYNDTPEHPKFAATALAHVADRLYKPAVRDGHPVPSQIASRVVLHLRLPIVTKKN